MHACVRKGATVHCPECTCLLTSHRRRVSRVPTHLHTVQELQFQKLNALKDVTDVKVTRNGVQVGG